MLLRRERLPVVKAVERLLGLQAQLPRPPFAGLWSRIEGFARADLAGALTARRIVRATSMRGTIHLMSAADFVAFRQCLQPGLDAGLRAILRERADRLDADALMAAADELLQAPHTFEQVRDHLVTRFRGGDARAMGYAVRMTLPLVQVPTDAPWAFPAQADFVSASAWLGRRPAPCRTPDALVLRYLAAYGPATIRDAEQWLGLGDLAGAFKRLGRKLVTLDGPGGKALYDLPDAPRPDDDTPAPVRFLPEWDSVVVTRADERIVARADRPRVFLPGLRVAAVVLVDGFAAATWKVARTAKAATLRVETFRPVAAKTRRAIEDEGRALVEFAEPDAASKAVEVVS